MKRRPKLQINKSRMRVKHGDTIIISKGNLEMRMLSLEFVKQDTGD